MPNDENTAWIAKNTASAENLRITDSAESLGRRSGEKNLPANGLNALKVVDKRKKICYNNACVLNIPLQFGLRLCGEVVEWPKAHAWKACVR